MLYLRQIRVRERERGNNLSLNMQRSSLSIRCFMLLFCFFGRHSCFLNKKRASATHNRNCLVPHIILSSIYAYKYNIKQAFQQKFHFLIGNVKTATALSIFKQNLRTSYNHIMIRQIKGCLDAVQEATRKIEATYILHDFLNPKNILHIYLKPCDNYS